MKIVLHWSFGVVKRCEINAMPCGDALHLLDPLRSDKPSPLREGFESAFKGQSHAFEQTPMDHIGERMAIQNSTKIRSESHSTGNLSQTSEENLGFRHLRRWRQVLRVACVTDDCVGRDAAQEKRRRCQTCRADHDVGFFRELLEIGCDLYL